MTRSAVLAAAVGPASGAATTEARLTDTLPAPDLVVLVRKAMISVATLDGARRRMPRAFLPRVFAAVIEQATEGA